MRESTVEREIKKFAKAHGITMQKQNGDGCRGKADQLCMKNGKAGFMEVKRPGGTPTALQLKYGREREADGFPVVIVDNIGDGIRWLRETFLK